MFTYSTARFSDCMQYRYTLARIWDDGVKPALFIMLNPSTADVNVDDPTVKRCRRYAGEWGYGGLMVGNLFALRSTDPNALYKHEDPVGPDNNEALNEMASQAGIIIAAWGQHGVLKGRAEEITEMFAGRLYSLKINKGGEPSHPLYLSKSLTPTLWI